MPFSFVNSNIISNFATTYLNINRHYCFHTMKIQLHQPQAIHELGSRKNQEDSIYPNKGEATADNHLFLVCDGMGGHDKGEVASAAVCQGMSQAMEAFLNGDELLTDGQFKLALEKTFETLNAADVAKEGIMGTTLTFLCFHKGGCLAAHIGDSRIYHLRPQTGEVLYRSRDHSLVQQLYELGEISYNDMATSPRKNIILKAMQPYQDELVEATLMHTTDIKKGDYFYLCSDGMLEDMEDDELLSILQTNYTDEEKAQELVRRTAGNADNHSAYLLQVSTVKHEDGDQLHPNDEAEARLANKALNDTHKDQVWNYNPNAEPITLANSKSRRIEKKKLLYLLAAALLSIALLVGSILLFSSKKEAKQTGGEENISSTEYIKDMLHNETTDDEQSLDAIPISAKPYLEKKALDKSTPVEPDAMPESKPGIVKEKPHNTSGGSATKKTN